MRILATSFILLTILLKIGAQESCYFTPPKEWDLIDPKQYSPHVSIGFVGKSSKSLAPTLNLAEEEYSMDLEKYVAAVKKIHESDPNNRWRDLGNFETKAGRARLTELVTQSEWGTVRMLQLLIQHNHKVYILTASSLKEEFPYYYSSFESAFHSLTITENLLEAIKDSKKREDLEHKLLQLSAPPQSAKDTPSPLWTSFQDTVIQQYADLGAHWQVLILKQASQKLISNPPEGTP